VEIVFTDTTNVLFEGIDIFGDPKSFGKLVSKDSCPYECFGFIILSELEIALTGFHDNDKSQLAVSIFARGKLESLKKDFKKFRIP